MQKDELIISKTGDRIERCRNGCYVTATDFLDSHQQALALRAARSEAGDVRTFMYGGYTEAERRMLVCIPAELPLSEQEAAEELVTVIRVTAKAGGRELSHRDYLGALLGLGIDRRVTGDILVRPDGADIIVLPEIAGFLLREFTAAGRTELTAREVSPVELIIPETKKQTIRDTVSSARLDNLTASAFRISRRAAGEAVRAGMVSVDHVEVTKPDARVGEGAVLVLKGKGKAVIKELGGESRKGRIRVTIDKML